MENALVVLEAEVVEVVPQVPAVRRALRAVPVPKKRRKMLDGAYANKNGISRYMTRKGERFLVQVRLAGKRPVSKSFSFEADAIQWKREEEAKLQPVAQASVPALLTLGDKLDRDGKVIAKGLFSMYVDACAALNPLKYSVVQMFKRLGAHPLLKDVRVADVNRDLAVAYCKSRRDEDGIAPSTIASEYTRICVALEQIAFAKGWASFDPLKGVRDYLMQNKLIADSKKRDRRPSAYEMQRLREYFSRPDRVSSIPMVDIINLAVVNAFRRGEIGNGRINGEKTHPLLWIDLDLDGESQGIYCWRKDSASEEVGEYKGKRRVLVPLFDAALEIIQRQPRVAAEIFPYSADAIGQQFGDAVAALRAEELAKDPNSKLFLDLHFHDLRHEAITTLSQEMGDSEGMQVSGHKSHRHYKRYINYQKADIKRIAAKGANIRPLGM